MCDTLFFHGDLENFGMPFERTHTNSRYGRSACKVGVQASKEDLGLCHWKTAIPVSFFNQL